MIPEIILFSWIYGKRWIRFSTNYYPSLPERKLEVNVFKQYVEARTPRHLFVYLSYGRCFLDASKDIKNTPDSSECALKELTGTHACTRAVIVCVCLCVFSHPVMPTSPLPPSSGQAWPICHIPPSIPSSIPPPSATLCPSLPLRIHPCIPSLLFLYLPPSLHPCLPPVTLKPPSSSPQLCSFFVLHSFLSS